MFPIRIPTLIPTLRALSLTPEIPKPPTMNLKIPTPIPRILKIPTPTPTIPTIIMTLNLSTLIVPKNPDSESPYDSNVSVASDNSDDSDSPHESVRSGSPDNSESESDNSENSESDGSG